MKITVLMENTACSEDLTAKHGLSLFIETNEQKILFDSGPNGDFWENAKKLNISIEQTDKMVLSHGHYDHGGGIETFLKVNQKANIYVNKRIFCGYYSEAEKDIKKYIGLDKKLEQQNRFIYGEGDRKIGENLFLFNPILENKYLSKTNNILYKLEEGEYKRDNFLHEQNLVIKENEKYVLIAGCAHSGIVNIIHQVEKRMNIQLDYVIGGFHLYSKIQKYCETEEYLEELAEELLKTNAIFYTCHCTGISQFHFLKEKMKERIFYLSTGNILQI